MTFEDADEEPIEFRMIGIGAVTYMNAQGWDAPLQKCWLRMEGAAVEEATGMDVVAGAGGLPGNVVALSYAEGIRMDPTEPDVVVATVDLLSAVSMYGSGVMQELRDTGLEAPVEAELTVVDGDIDSWILNGETMAAALDRENALKEPSDDLLTALASSDVAVEYEDVGVVEVNVRAPAPALQMTPDELDKDQGCPAVR